MTGPSWAARLALFFFFLLVVDNGWVLGEHFLNEWTAEIPGGLPHATEVAEQHGYRLVRELHSLPDHYILHRSDTAHRSKRSADHHTQKLQGDHRVAFVQQQQSKDRPKRDTAARAEARAIAESDWSNLNDPGFGEEWYIDSRNNGRRQPDSSADLKVTDAWRKGFTGKGVVVTILDDGIEWSHDDLAANYDPDASYDYNDDDADPFPRYDITNENKHGTRCAGEVAMVANNNKCGVGVAFDSKIGGLRILDGKVTDRLEGEALGFNISHVDIFSASWGPTDDGTHMEGPSYLTEKALLKGINEGRGGRGGIYVWASGNGGGSRDSCSADGYTSSIYTIGVSSSTQHGRSPWYTESCPSTLTTTGSSGMGSEKKVTTTDLHNLCTSSHSGTSAAAPMAAGVLALLLEANRNLTWRDVQHIVIHTSSKEPLSHETGWYTNAAGYCVNLKFGFGLMDAGAMVDLANNTVWQNVGPQKMCQVQAADPAAFPQRLSAGNFVEVEFTTDGCEGQLNEVNYLEHVLLNLTLDYPLRGRISAELESPSGTVVQLISERPFDRSNKGFQNWPLMSAHTWGEQPEGTWKFRVADKVDGPYSGKLRNATLTLYGTTEQPNHLKTQPPKCGQNQRVDLRGFNTKRVARVMHELGLQL